MALAQQRGSECRVYAPAHRIAAMRAHRRPMAMAGEVAACGRPGPWAIWQAMAMPARRECSPGAIWLG